MITAAELHRFGLRLRAALVAPAKRPHVVAVVIDGRLLCTSADFVEKHVATMSMRLSEYPGASFQQETLDYLRSLLGRGHRHDVVVRHGQRGATAEMHVSVWGCTDGAWHVSLTSNNWDIVCRGTVAEPDR